MADPLDFNPFLTESQRRQIRSNVAQGPELSDIQDIGEYNQRVGQLNATMPMGSYRTGMLPKLGATMGPEQSMQRQREAEAANPEYVRARDQARAAMENRVMQRTRDAQRQNRLDAVSSGVGQEFPGMNPQDLVGMSVGELEQMRAQQPNRLNIKGIPADSQYAQEARRQAGISEAEFDRRLLEVLDVMRSPEYRDLNNPMPGGRSMDELRQMVEGLGVTADAPFPGETRQIQRRPMMPGGRSMDELSRQLDRVQRMELQRAPQRQRDMVFARDEQIQGSPRGEMGRFYGPQGRTEDIDPLLIQATPQPRTSAQLAESARAKAGSGQPLDAEERQWFSSTIRKQMQDAGYTEEQIQRQMERIDPETGMLPRRMR